MQSNKNAIFTGPESTSPTLLSYRVVDRDGKSHIIKTASNDIDEIEYSLNEKSYTYTDSAGQIQSAGKYDPITRDKTINFDFSGGRSVFGVALSVLDDHYKGLMNNLFQDKGVQGVLKSPVSVADYVRDISAGTTINAIGSAGTLVRGALITGSRFETEKSIKDPTRETTFGRVRGRIMETLGLGELSEAAAVAAGAKETDVLEKAEAIKETRLNAIEQAKNNARLFYDKLGNGLYDKVQKWNEEHPAASVFGSLAGNVGLSMGLSVLTKNPIAITGLFYLNSISEKYGEIYENYKAEGLNDDEAFAMAENISKTYGGIISATEFVGDLVFLRALGRAGGGKAANDLTAKAKSKLMQKISGFTENAYLGGAVSEGLLEELPQTVIGGLFSNWFGGQNKSLGEIVNNGIEAAALGALGGLMFAGAFDTGRGVLGKFNGEFKDTLIEKAKEMNVPRENRAAFADYVINEIRQSVKEEADALTQGAQWQEQKDKYLKDIDAEINKINNQTEFEGEDVNNGIAKGKEIDEQAKQQALKLVEERKEEAEKFNIRNDIYDDLVSQGYDTVRANEAAFTAQKLGMLWSKATDYKVKPQEYYGRIKNIIETEAEFSGQEAANFQTAQPVNTETPEFKKWFGDSKIVDDKKRPLKFVDVYTPEFKFNPNAILPNSKYYEVLRSIGDDLNNNIELSIEKAKDFVKSAVEEGLYKPIKSLDSIEERTFERLFEEPIKESKTILEWDAEDIIKNSPFTKSELVDFFNDELKKLTVEYAPQPNRLFFQNELELEDLSDKYKTREVYIKSENPIHIDYEGATLEGVREGYNIFDMQDMDERIAAEIRLLKEEADKINKADIAYFEKNKKFKEFLKKRKRDGVIENLKRNSAEITDGTEKNTYLLDAGASYEPDGTFDLRTTVFSAEKTSNGFVLEFDDISEAKEYVEIAAKKKGRVRKKFAVMLNGGIAVLGEEEPKLFSTKKEAQEYMENWFMLLPSAKETFDEDFYKKLSAEARDPEGKINSEIYWFNNNYKANGDLVILEKQDHNKKEYKKKDLYVGEIEVYEGFSVSGGNARIKYPKLNEILEYAKENGYDGATVSNIYNEIDDTTISLVGVIDETQIKSVDNRGTFDPENPNIYYQTAKNEISNKIKTINERQAKEYTPIAKASKEIKEIFKAAGEITNIDIGNTKFPTSAAGKLIRHKGFDISSIAQYLPEIYKDALLISSVKEQEYTIKHKPHNNIAVWHNLLNKFKVNGEEYYIRFTVQEMKTRKKTDTGDKFLHSAFVSEIHLYKKETSGTLDTKNNLGRTPLVDNILKDIFGNVNKNQTAKTNEPLGSFTATENGFLIRLFENANDSTIIHEQLGHAYLTQLEMIQNETPEEERSGEFNAMINGLNKYLGGLRGGKYTMAQQEKFAKAAVSYVKEGKFPDAETETVFAQFKRWLADIWEFLVENKMTANLNAEVRRTFDYLLESEKVDETYFQEMSAQKTAEVLKKLKNNDFKNITEEEIMQAKETLRQFKKKRIQRPSGKALQRKLEKYGLKANTGDVEDIKGDNKKIKIYRRGEKGYEKALNIDLFLNAQSGGEYYLSGDNSSIVSEQGGLYEKLKAASQGKPVYTTEEQERMPEYETETANIAEAMNALELEDMGDVNEALGALNDLQGLKIDIINRVGGYKGEKAIENALERLVKDINSKTSKPDDSVEAWKLHGKITDIFY